MKSELNFKLEKATMVPLVVKWRKLLIVVAVMAFVTSVLISFLIEEKYESTVIMFPAATNNISGTLLSEKGFEDKSLLEFGEEEQVEQMIQILNSDVIRDKIIKKYNLLTHYKIDQVQKYKMTKLYNEYDANVSFSKTPYMSVEITVLDKDPAFAANIANDISSLLDTTINKMQHRVAQQALAIVKKQYDGFKLKLDSMHKQMDYYRSLGVQDYSTQVEVLTEQYAIALQKNNIHAMQMIKNNLDTLAKYGGKYQSMSQDMDYKIKHLNWLQTKYQEAKVDAEQSVEHKFIVDKAYKAEKPSYPIKWLIVAVSVIGSVLFALIVLTIVEVK